MHFQSIPIAGLALLAGVYAQSTSLSSLVFSTDGVTGSMTAFTTRVPVPTTALSTTGSSVVLSGTQSSTSSTVSGSTSSASQAAATSSHNAQVRIGTNDAMLGVFGAIAGLVAFV